LVLLSIWNDLTHEFQGNPVISKDTLVHRVLLQLVGKQTRTRRATVAKAKGQGRIAVCSASVRHEGVAKYANMSSDVWKVKMLPVFNVRRTLPLG